MREPRDSKRTGQILVEQGSIDEASLEAAMASEGPGPLASRLVERGVVSEVDALRALSLQRGVPGLDLRQICVHLTELEAIPRTIALAHKLLPVLSRADRLFVAMANPEDRKVLEELEFVTGKHIFAYIGLESALLRTIREAYDARDRGESHYVGPDCTSEMLAQAGLDPVAYGRPPCVSPDEIEPAPRSEHRRPPAIDARAEGGVAASTRVERVGLRPIVGRDRTAELGEQPPPGGTRDAPSFALGDVAPQTNPLPTPLPPPSEGTDGRLKVLVVDDEADIRRMIRRVLEDRGFAVVEADRGRLALQLVKLESPDLLVLDAMLPEVHGFDIARRVRNSTRYGHIPIVMVSAVYRGWRFAEDARQSYGVDAYLEKPFKVQDLVNVVERALEVRRDRADPDAMSAEAEALLERGLRAYRSGDLDAAVSALEQGVAIDPLAFRLHFHLGLLHGKRGQVYDAIEQLERALAIHPSHFGGLKNLAVLYQQAGFRNKAVEAWERALCVSPDAATRAAIKDHIVSLL
jgi:DNA-binding response OmpR family regulator